MKLQVNERTSWIDASFLYSIQEPWIAALRAWHNGSLLEGTSKGYPPLNGPHIPLINPVPPQIHRLMNPERLFSKSFFIFPNIRHCNNYVLCFPPFHLWLDVTSPILRTIYFSESRVDHPLIDFRIVVKVIST